EGTVPKEFNEQPTTEFVDAERLGTKLVVRNWKEGDWFFPLGLRVKKKLSDFLVDKKIPLFEKHRIPLLESEGAIVWVCGHRIDERFKVTPKTASVVKLQYVPFING
ncbi:MAG: tRNA lysidine(34) synthetase TilS, partial [Bacteroidota bacterium]